ncbi:ribonuclease H-like domain-containing protein [Tanacetum coccineum]
MKNSNVFSQESNEENSLKFFDVQNPESPYDEEGDTSTEDDNSRIASDDCTAVEDEVARGATHIEENVTSEGNVHVNQNGEGRSSPIGFSPDLRRSIRPKVMPARFNDFVVNSSVRYGLEKYVCYNNLSKRNLCFSTTLNKTTEPKIFQEASQNPKWVEFTNHEMEALFRNNTYVLVDLPPKMKAIGYEWLWKIKYKSSGEVERYKARFVTKGDLKEDVYMELPLGYYDKNETRVFKLVKSLYGLKQAPRQWNEKLTAALIEHGFVQSKNDYSLYIKDKNGVFIAILVYVDDIVVTCNNNSEFEKYKHFLCTKFLIKDLGQLKYFLGIEVLEIESGLLECCSWYHFSADLRVLRYLKNAPGTGVQFLKENSFSLYAFSDGLNVLRPENLYLYRCLASTTCVVIGVIKILKDLGVEGLLPVNLYCDSSFAFLIAGNPVFHEKTKHFEIDLHLLMEDDIMETTRRREKWENDDYICGGHISNEDASSKKFLTQHGLKMDESISISSVIDKLPPSWKDFKHTLKHGKDDLSLVQLGSHLRIEESLRA